MVLLYIILDNRRCGVELTKMCAYRMFKVEVSGVMR